jgi:pimeloyl-ACP methyl ester carboxylesterase
MPVVSAGEVELSYQRSGSGPPLLLIMGMGGTFSHWGAQFLEPLREDFDVIAYDHRGVGQSSRMVEPFTLAQLAADAAGLLAALDVESAHVLGISMGGMVAQELALAHPERVRTLALGCTYCGGEGSSLAPPAVAQRLVEALRSGDRERALRTGWEIGISAPMVHDDDAYAAFRDLCLRRPVAQTVIMAQMRAIAAHDTSTRLPQLRMPTLIVHGTADQLIPVENADVLAGHLPHARREILDGVGHRFFWEEPQRSAELVRDHAGLRVAGPS